MELRSAVAHAIRGAVRRHFERASPTCESETTVHSIAMSSKKKIVQLKGQTTLFGTQVFQLPDGTKCSVTLQLERNTTFAFIENRMTIKHGDKKDN